MKIRGSYIVSILVLSVVISGCGANSTNSESPSPSSSSSTPLPTESSSASPSEVPSETPGVTLLQEFKERALANAPADELFASLKQMISQVQPAVADDLIRTLDAYYKDNLPLVEKQFEPEKVQNQLNTMEFPFTKEMLPNVKDESVRTLIEKTLAGGYRLETTEGYVFPIVDYSELLAFSDNVTTQMKTYLELMAMESNAMSASDGGIVISWDELASRVLAAESYVVMFPDSEERVKVEETYIRYLNFYLIGLNNTPIFDYETFTLLPDKKSQYEQMIGSHSGTFTGQLTKQLLEVLSKSKDVLFTKDKNGEQTYIPAVKAFYDSLESTARSQLPSGKK
jgi:hypothetical protein